MRELLASILTGVSRAGLLSDGAALRAAHVRHCRPLPVCRPDLHLDAHGIQTSDNVACPRRAAALRNSARGQDRASARISCWRRAADEV